MGRISRLVFLFVFSCVLAVTAAERREYKQYFEPFIWLV